MEAHMCIAGVTTLQRVDEPDEAGVSVTLRTTDGKEYEFAFSLPTADTLRSDLQKAMEAAAEQYARHNPSK